MPAEELIRKVPKPAIAGLATGGYPLSTENLGCREGPRVARLQKPFTPHA
jgi:hypothetical protein